MSNVEIKLPDFDRLFELSNTIRDLSLEKLTVENEISMLEAQAIEHGIRNIKIGGKTASMDYLKSTVKYSGVNGEILPLRKKLVEITVDLDKYKNYMQIFRDMISIYQTESANRRASLL